MKRKGTRAHKTKPVRARKTWRDRAPSVIVNASFGLGIFSMIPEINRLDNTLGGVELLWVGALTGVTVVTLGVVPFVLRRRFQGGWPMGWGFLWVLAGVAMFSAAMASRANRTFASERMHERSYRVTEKSETSARGRRGRRYNPTPLLFLDVEGASERIAVSKTLWDATAVGDWVRVEEREGFFGYPLVVNGRARFD